jgi:hypothetical protein
MSCIIKNIDNFCANVLSLQISGGAYNNTTVNIELLDHVDIGNGSIGAIVENLELGEILPLSDEDFIPWEYKHKKSASGVTSSHQFIDKYSHDADSFMIGLTGRSFGDISVGREYFLGKGLNHRDGIDGFNDILFTYPAARIVYNSLATPGTYLKANGCIGCLPVGHDNWDNPPNMTDPEIGFGDIFYRWSELVNGLTSLGIILNDGLPKDFNGLYNYDGTIRDVLGNLGRQHGLVYAPNALNGGHVFIDVSGDFGKKGVLEAAGIGVPESATESSFSNSRADGYSTGSFLRSWHEGAKQTADDIVLPRRAIAKSAERKCKPNGSCIHAFGGSPKTGAEYARYDDPWYWGKAGIEPTNPQDAKRINFTTAFRDQKMPNFEDGLGGSSIESIGTAIAAELASTTQLAKDVDTFYRMKESGQKAASEEAIINTFTGQEGYPFIKGGKLIEGWQMFEGVNEQLAEIENYNSYDTDNLFWKNCGTSGKRYSRTLHDLWLQLQAKIYVITEWDGDNISEHGDQVATWDNTTYGWANFGDKGVPLGEKFHYSMNGEPLFSLYQEALNASPLAALMNIPEYAGLSLGEALKKLYAADARVDMPDLNAGSDSDQYVCRGCIIIDNGPSEVTRETLGEGLEKYVESGSSDIYLIAEDAHGMPNDKSLAGKVIMKTSGADSPIERWNAYKEGIQTALKSSIKGDGLASDYSNSEIEVWWDGVVGSKQASGQWTSNDQGSGPTIRGGPASAQTGKNGPRGRASKEYGAYGAKNRFHHRHESTMKKSGKAMPNRSIATGDLHYSYDEAEEGYGPLYIDSQGIMNKAVHGNSEAITVDSLSKISFTLVNELYNFSQNDHMKYLESMNVSVAAGKLTASYTFSQKIQIPDLASLYTANARAQQVR